MMDYLGNFARTGDPNGTTTPPWNQFAARPSPSTELMVLGDGAARMAPMPDDVIGRYSLLAEQYCKYTGNPHHDDVQGC